MGHPKLRLLLQIQRLLSHAKSSVYGQYLSDGGASPLPRSKPAGVV